MPPDLCICMCFVCPLPPGAIPSIGSRDDDGVIPGTKEELCFAAAAGTDGAAGDASAPGIDVASGVGGIFGTDGRSGGVDNGPFGAFSSCLIQRSAFDTASGDSSGKTKFGLPASPSSANL